MSSGADTTSKLQMASFDSGTECRMHQLQLPNSMCLQVITWTGLLVPTATGITSDAAGGVYDMNSYSLQGYGPAAANRAPSKKTAVQASNRLVEGLMLIVLYS